MVNTYFHIFFIFDINIVLIMLFNIDCYAYGFCFGFDIAVVAKIFLFSWFHHANNYKIIFVFQWIHHSHNYRIINDS